MNIHVTGNCIKYRSRIHSRFPRKRHKQSRAPQTHHQTLTQSGFPPGVVNDSPSQDEPQSYPLAQIAEFLTRDPITKEECIPIFSAVSLKKKKKMLFAPMDFQDLTLDALQDSGSPWPNVSSAPRKSNSLGERFPQQEWHPRATRSRNISKPSNSPERRRDFKDTSGL